MKNYTSVKVRDKSWGLVRLEYRGRIRRQRNPYSTTLFLTVYNKDNSASKYWKYEIGNLQYKYKSGEHKEAVSHINTILFPVNPSMFWR